MARKARVNLTVASIAIPPADTRPVGPLTSEEYPYGQCERSGSMRSDVTRGGEIYCSDVMSGRAGGQNVPWKNGIRTVSVWELNHNNPYPQRGGGEVDEDEHG